jgi:1,4-dihydroxy-2-naphthoate octaprenyltransferase
VSFLRALARLARPLYLLFAALTYSLGAGVARYLGTPIKVDVMLLGLVGVALAQTGMDLLAVVFRPEREPLLDDETPGQRRVMRRAALYTSLAALSAFAFTGLAIERTDGLSTPALLCFVFSFLVIFIFSIPPVRAMDKGFGELLLAVQIAYLAPSIGFLLQGGSHHRLLNACTATLTLLLVATLVALEFPSYAEDLKYGRATLLTRLGWENGLRLHNALMVAAYALLVLATLLGFSFGLFLPAFLTVPFVILQVVLLHNIAAGAKPVWSLLNANGAAIFGLATYFLTLSFWLR